MTQCFLVMPSSMAVVRLRRYAHEWDSAANAPMAWTRCAANPYGYHNADGPLLGEFPQPLDPVERCWRHPVGVPEIDHADPRWPTKCVSCDYQFTPADERQYWAQLIYLDAQGGRHFMLDKTPGMMWYATWYHDPTDPRDAATRAHALANPTANHYLSPFYWQDWSMLRAPISVNCPNGAEWCVDAKSNNGPGWTVVGDAPMLTCSPSIAVPGYHGFLQNGVFTPNL